MAAGCQQSIALSMRCVRAYSMGYCYASGCSRVAGTLEQVGDCVASLNVVLASITRTESVSSIDKVIV